MSKKWIIIILVIIVIVAVWDEKSKDSSVGSNEIHFTGNMCTYCQGSGKVKCRSGLCASGICELCNGTGRNTRYPNVDCSLCKNGRHSICNGTGLVDCAPCRGTGKRGGY